MSITRRSVLRNLGALTAAQTLSAGGSLLIGCKSRSAAVAPALAPQTLRVIFEGPWVFTHAPGDRTTLIARAEVVAPHVARCGKWTSGGLAVNGIPQPAPSGRWRGSFSPAQTPSDFAVLRDAYIAAKAVLVKNFRIDEANFPTDFSVSLPMPNKVLLGGALIHAKIKDIDGILPAGAIPMTDTILHYDQNSGTTPFTLNIGDGTNQFAVNPSDDLVFRIHHNLSTDCTPDSVHIPRAFSRQCLRLLDGSNKNPRLSVTLPHSDYTPNQLPDGITDAELGLGMGTEQPCGRAKIVKAVYEVPAEGGIFTPAYSDYASCAGGGIGVD